jgi:hypothetical protein
MVGVGVGNACNSNPSPATKFVFINYCGGWGFSASPNPSHGQTTIATTQTQAQSAKELSQTKIYQIKILDQSGIILKQYSYSGGITNTAINLSNLVGGVYLIQAFNGSTWASQQILKQ